MVEVIYTYRAKIILPYVFELIGKKSLMNSYAYCVIAVNSTDIINLLIDNKIGF